MRVKIVDAARINAGIRQVEVLDALNSGWKSANRSGTHASMLQRIDYTQFVRGMKGALDQKGATGSSIARCSPRRRLPRPEMV